MSTQHWVHRTESAAERRAALCLLVVAAALLLVAAMRGLTEPWEGGMRGTTAAYYSDGFVAHTLRYGLSNTLGMPAFITETETGLERGVNWHHPPLYWLFLTLSASIFGHCPATLRITHLIMFLPGLLGLFLVVKRRVGALAAGCAALLFASSPLVAYFGPMVLQDGAVLGVGLVTVWCFDRHLVRGGTRWLVAAAGGFLLACLYDFPGYWWGTVMFVLALGESRRRRGLIAVVVMFAASVAAFVITALHYGIELGGPLGYVRSLLGAISVDRVDVPITEERIDNAVHELLFDYLNWPLLAMALLGALVGALRARGLLLLGVALLLPGACNVAAMFSHALAHVFWSMHGFGGLAVLAAILPVQGLGALRTARSRALGGLMLAVATAVVVSGVVATHSISSRFAFVDNGTHAVMREATPLLEGCANALVSSPAVSQKYFGGVSTWGGIDTPEKLELVLDLGRRTGVRGDVGVVVAPWHRNSPLSRLLDDRAERQVAGDVWVYRLRL